MHATRLVFNTIGGTRRTTLEGRSYLVAPCVMGVEGVLSGSDGPGFYSKAEWAKAAPVWNSKPITVYHPEIDGQPVTASLPAIIESQKIGMVLNTRWAGKLRTELWCDEEKTKQVDERVYKALITNQKMEVSTGLYLNRRPSKGEHNGTSYDWIAEDHQPDHLAILPTGVGACSLKDGAGMLVTNEGTESQLPPEAMTVNDLSYSDIRNLVYMAVCEKFAKPGYSWSGYVMDIYPGYVIYSADGGYYRLDYTMADNEVTLSGDPMEVVRETLYRAPTTNEVVGLTSNVTSIWEKEPVNKTDTINKLIANGQFAAADKAFLEGKDEAWLTKTLTTNATPAPTVPPPVPAPVPQMTFNQFLESAPPEYKSMVELGIATHKAEHDNLVAAITANTAGSSAPMNPEWLKKQNVETLRALVVNTAPKQQAPTIPGANGMPPATLNPVYLGQQGAGWTNMQPAPTFNQTLVPPELD